MMSYKCPRCSRRVFFAERTVSLGKDWHQKCLTCKACSKVLNPGQHIEYDGVPYCDESCSKTVFGAKINNQRSRAESNEHSHSSPPIAHKKLVEPQSNQISITTNNNHVNISMSSPRIDGRAPKVSKQQLMELEKKLMIHNDAHRESFISLIEKDGHVTLEGALRVHWGVQIPITFKKDDTNETTPFTKRLVNRRINKTRSFHNDIYADIQETKDPFETMKSKGIPSDLSSQQLLAVKMQRGQFHTVRENKVKRRCSINGHFYKAETCDNFTPAFGSVTNVFVGSHHRTSEVIKRLLDKFKIENSPSSFALYLVKPNGEMWPLSEADYPLMERINLMDAAARMFLMDKPHQVVQRDSIMLSEDNIEKPAALLSVWKPVEEKEEAIPQEIVSFINLPDAMLNGFIQMFNEQEEAAVDDIKKKYQNVRETIKELMAAKQLTEETYL